MNPSHQLPWLEVIGGNRWILGADKNELKLTVAQVAKALSQINRFTGHTRSRLPYSVAQHSLFVSELLDLDPTWAMAGLMHDAGEMIIGDVATPLKLFLTKPIREALDAEEMRAQVVISRALGLPDVMLPMLVGDMVAHADAIACITEKRDLLDPKIVWDTLTHVRPHPKRIIPLPAPEVVPRFCARFYELKQRLLDE